MKKRIELEVGTLELDIHGNQYADISFIPSSSFVEELALQTQQTSAKAHKSVLPPNTHGNSTPAKQTYFASTGHSFSELSRLAQSHIRAKKFALYSRDLSGMADIVKTEGKRRDELKIRMMKFHIDLSGIDDPPFVDWTSAALAKEASESSGIKGEALDELFFSVIRTDMTPGHAFTVVGSHRMFLLALAGNTKKISEIIDIVLKYWDYH